MPRVIFRLKIFLFGILGLGAVCLTVWIVWVGAERTPRRYFEAAEQKWRENDYLGAVRGYEKITEEYPRSRWAPEASYWSGVIYSLYLNEPQKAVEIFQKTIERTRSSPKNPQTLSARRYLAEIYERSGKSQEAISEYEKLIELSPDPDQVSESRYKIGELYFALGDLEQARGVWDLLVKKDPKSRWAPEALYRSGGAYFVAGKCKEAMEIYQKALADYPQSDVGSLAKFRIANCLEEGRRSKEALQLYKELVGLYPNPDLLADKIHRLEGMEPANN